MIEEHARKLKKLERTQGLDLFDMLQLYSVKQTEYLKRDLNIGVPIHKYMRLNHYGERAVNAMNKFVGRKGPDEFRTYLNGKLDYRR